MFKPDPTSQFSSERMSGELEGRLSQRKDDPGFQRKDSSFSLDTSNTKNSKGTQSSVTSVHSSRTGSSHTDKWTYLFKEADEAFKPVDSVLVQGDDRNISMRPDGVHVAPRELNKIKAGKPNTLRTTRFTLLTWIPLSLMNQFKRIANVYFLCICVIVIFPWSPKSWHSKLGPFILVLLWTACKDMMEDLRRRKDDKAENSQKVQRFVTGKNGAADKFEWITWKDVLVGDVLFIVDDTAFPADMLLLHPAGGSECFISTVMLDGETSLKERSAPSVFEAFSRECGNKGAHWTGVAAQSEEREEEGTGAALDHGTTFDQADLERAQTVSNWTELEPEIQRYLRIIGKVGVHLQMASPTPTLQDVRGAIHTRSENPSSDSTAVCPFTEINFLPRGCMLRNTPWVIAIATYVGDDSKCRMNAMRGRVNKFSNMQSHLNQVIVGLLVFLFALCTASTIVYEAGDGTLSEHTGIDDHFIIMFLKFTVIFYHIVPLSLYVVYEMLKLFLGYLLAVDKQMVDPDTNEGAVPRTADLMEEMGQISFIFSDKTGTLTRNEMVFAQCDINGVDMGEFRGDDASGLKKVKQVISSGQPAGTPSAVQPTKLANMPSESSEGIDIDEAGERAGQGRAEAGEDNTFLNVVDFFTCLAVCHSVVPQRDKDGYSGASPDEVSLVYAAAQAGIVFKGRKRKYAGSSSELMVHGPGDRHRTFVQLFELPFSSDRKRMSVIVKHRSDIWCITKGADSVMEQLLREPLSADSQRHLTKYAEKGLRTLIVAMKKVSAEEFAEWNMQYIAAREVINTTKESGMAAVASRMEKNMKFVGITAVDDRLQDQVPETIRLMKSMGIRLWVLTGDKTETAVDIARSASLFTSSTTLAYAVKAKDGKDAEDWLLKAYSELEGKTDTGVVLDGQTLMHALQRSECRKVIYDLGMATSSCICTRLSPAQKLQLVQLVREQDPKTITLSVGDGANDVPMIYGAHLGIAIRGKEGTQAVQASDIAISQFRYLTPLLLCHGRRAYRRVATFLCFFLYKNICLIMLDIVWMFQFKFKGMVAVPEWLSINFNPIFTSLHMLLVLGLDRDISDEDANAMPELYKVGPACKLFNTRVFVKWLATAIYHGAVCWVLPYNIFIKPDITGVNKKDPSEFWVSSVTSFSCVVFVVCLKLMLVAQNPLGLHTWLPTLITFMMLFLAIFCFSYVLFGPKMQPNMSGIFGDMFGNNDVYISVVAVIVVALLPDVIMTIFFKIFRPSELEVARRRARKNTPAEQ